MSTSGLVRTLKPYPAYKDSGLPWLATIPAHWEVRRNGRLFVQRNETGFPDLPILEVSLKTGVRVRDFDTSKRKQVMSDREKYKCARHGDIAYNMMRMWQGAVGVAPVDGLVSPAYVVARPLPETESRYYEYLFRTDAYMNEVNRFSRGIVSDRNRLYWEDFKQMPSPFPPPAEQVLIARFLEHLDRRVRCYLSAKRRIIDLLNEQKQAIIHHAVTRGLNPNVRPKPSDVEWLGEVPEHWQPVRLKHVARVQTGVTLGKNYGQVPLEQRPYLRVANVQSGRLDLTTVKTIAVPAKEASGAELKAGDVLMTEGGDIDKLGRGCVWHGEIDGCLHQNHIFAVRPDQARLLPEYLVAVMASQQGRIYFEITAKKTTNLASTNSSTLGAFPLVLPEVIEQRALLDNIRLQTQSLDAAIAGAEREVAVLREYRTRLVADAVTGKLDVRQVAACLPDEVREAEPTDETDLIAGDGEEDDFDAEPEEAVA
ncbi:MAG TPA: restriction endonuclease subunit S [Sedimentisphaerales bacterium]|nr:restriction endonuclease subunit S [Sedimentisphaerales bacterium]